MDAYDEKNGVSKPSDNQEPQGFDKIIKLYTSKWHIVMIILDLVVGSVELGHGIRYNNQCPIQPLIVTFLIVHGAVSLFSGLIIILAMITANIVCRHNGQTIPRILFFILFLILIVVNLFFFAWFVAANVWVFGAKANGVQGNDSTNSATYCQADLYRAAIVLIIARYIVIPIIIVIVIIRRLCKRSK